MKNVLLVEDDAVVASIYRNKLQMENMVVDWVKDSEQALLSLSKKKPDLVLLELLTPNIKGLDIIKRLRSAPETKSLPIFVLTNGYMSQLTQEAWQAGATQCITKLNTPPREILKLVVQALADPPAAATPSSGITSNDPATRQILEAMRAILAPSSAGAAGAETAAPGASSKTREAAMTPLAPVPDEGQQPLPVDIAPSAGRNREPRSSEPLAAPISPAPVAPVAVRAENQSPGSNLGAAFESQLRQTFLECAPQWLAFTRELWRKFLEAQNDSQRLPLLHELCRKVHWFAGSAAVTEIQSVACLATPLEALLMELSAEPKHLNASTVRTVTQALEALYQLLTAAPLSTEPAAPLSILAVDDDPVARMAVSRALMKANLKPVSVEDGNVAYSLASQNSFDLIITDIDMPGLDGLALCNKLRALPQYKTTPILFVTKLTELNTRSQATQAGGNDFICKPFLASELAVKVMLQLSEGKTTAPAS